MKKTYFLVFSFFPLILYLLGFRYVVVLTDSMHPGIPRWSLVVSAPKYLVTVENGSVILYRLRLHQNEYLILHRVVSVKSGTYYTKGDNRNFIDPWKVPSEAIVGVAIIYIPYLGFLILLSRIILLPVIGYVVFVAIHEFFGERQNE